MNYEYIFNYGYILAEVAAMHKELDNTIESYNQEKKQTEKLQVI